jgi:hypothetical protein
MAKAFAPEGFLTWPQAVRLWLAHKRPGETMTMALFDEGGQWLIEGLRDRNLKAYVADNADARLEPDWSQWLGRSWDAMTPLERLRDPKERVLRGDWACVAGKEGLFCFKETELVRRLVDRAGGPALKKGRQLCEAALESKKPLTREALRNDLPPVSNGEFNRVYAELKKEFPGALKGPGRPKK